MPAWDRTVLGSMKYVQYMNKALFVDFCLNRIFGLLKFQSYSSVNKLYMTCSY